MQHQKLESTYIFSQLCVQRANFKKDIFVGFDVPQCVEAILLAVHLSRNTMPLVRSLSILTWVFQGLGLLDIGDVPLLDICARMFDFVAYFLITGKCLARLVTRRLEGAPTK